MPELADEEPALEDALEEDAADADKRRERLAQERLEIERQKRSQPVKMDLPRPAVPQACLFPTSFAPGDPQCGPPGSLSSQLLHQAESLLHEEMSALVANDAFLFPVKGGKPPNKKPDELQDFQLDEINAAHELLQAELSQFDGGEFVNLSALQAGKDEGQNFTFVPTEKRYKEWRLLAKREMLEAAKNIFEMSEKEMQRENKRSQKVEVKLERVLGGHMMKARTSLQKIAALAEERDTLEVETDVFRTLRAREESAVASRVEEVRELVEKEKQRNAKLQARYRDLQLLQKQLEEKLA
jgi:pre-mRNA-splicing factor CDC5/CEF1